MIDQEIFAAPVVFSRERPTRSQRYSRETTTLQRALNAAPARRTL
jgi:hypothetical protein